MGAAGGYLRRRLAGSDGRTMSGAELEISVGIIVAAFTIVGGAFFRRSERQRENTGRRIGRLEAAYDFERGRRAGIAEERRRRGGRAQ